MKKAGGWGGGSRKRKLLQVLCVGALLWSVPAAASELSKRLYGRGLIEFHADHFQEALQLFNKAVEADDRDALAVYYRGVTRGRLDDRTGAIKDLQEAVRLKPDLHEADLDLGVMLIEAGRVKEAIPPLERARNSADLDSQASLYLGIAWLRLDEYDKAETYLEYVRVHDPNLEPTARYYLGVIDYKHARFAAARAEFLYAMSARPNSRVSTEAQNFLGQIDQAESDRTEVFGALGLQYDSNVILAPSGGTASSQAQSDVGVTGQSDGRVTINAGGNYLLGRSDWGRLVVGYEFYQSLHFQLHQFNLQDHRANVVFSAQTGPVHWGAIGRYDYFLLETSDFLREGTLIPYLAVPEGDVGWTEVSAQIRRRDFLQPQYEIRDATNYAPSVTQIFYIQKNRDRYLTLGYMWDQEDTGSIPANHVPNPAYDPHQYQYNGNQFSIGLGWELPFDIASEIDYVYKHSIYDPVPSNNRRDDEQHIIVVARRPITEHLSVSAGYFGQWNQTNSVQIINGNLEKLYEYNRQIVSVAVEVRF